jgi:predicted enzyme related to lactoylglutathione lyase
MIEGLRSVRYTVGSLALAEQWYSQLLDVRPYQSTDSVLRYCVDGSWLELVETRTDAASSVLVYWGVDSLQLELLRLQELGIQPQTPPAVLDATARTATFLDPFGNTVGLIEMHDPGAERARAHRAAEKIALRNVREALDGLSAEERQQRAANRLVLVLVLVVLGLVLGSFGLWKVLPHKAPEEKIVIPLSGKK